MEPPEKKDEDEPFVTTGPTLDAEGNLEAATRPVEPHRSSVLRPLAPRGEPQPELELEERPRAAPLELEARAPRPETHYVAPPAPAPPRLNSGPSAGSLLLLLVLGILGAFATYYFFFRVKETPQHSQRPVAVTITITSEPSGAAVNVEGTAVGVTPWATDNIWAEGPVNVTLTLPGYRPWSGTFPGARPARLEARLQRR